MSVDNPKGQNPYDGSEFENNNETADWRELSDDVDDGLKVLSPDELSHVTMAATVDVTDCSPPRVNWILGKADQFERQFLSEAQGKDVAVSPVDTSEWTHADGQGFERVDADTCWMEVVVDVSDMNGRETSRVMEKAEKIENEFLNTVGEYTTAV